MWILGLKKKNKKKTTLPRKRSKIVHSLDLIRSRAILAVKNYVDYPIDDNAHITMQRFLKDYKPHKAAVKDSLVYAFKFLTKDRYIVSPDDPPDMREPNPKPSKDTVLQAKKHINKLAKKVWKK